MRGKVSVALGSGGVWGKEVQGDSRELALTFGVAFALPFCQLQQ